jgi:hypothetical protein
MPGLILLGGRGLPAAFGRVGQRLQRHRPGRASDDLAHLRGRDLRPTVGGEQPVLLLLGVGELGVAETGERPAVEHGVDEVGQLFCELLLGRALRVPPALVIGVEAEAHPAELGEHHRPVAGVEAREQHRAHRRAPGPHRLLDRGRVGVPLPQVGAARGVVVHADDVAAAVLPAVVREDRAARVDCLGQVVQRLGEAALRGLGGRVLDTPALVHRHPGDHARMAAVAAYDVEPLAGQPFDGDRAELVGVGHLAPHEQAEPVAPVQEPRVLDLLVDAYGVEPELLDQLHLTAQCVRAGSGQV